ncbi:MAG: DMT family transporter [Candidatus Heimdallarchaeota archaeon]
MAWIYALAIFLGVLSYSMLNVGMGLQKKGADSLPKIDKQKVWQNLKNFFTNKTWLFGFILVQSQWILLTMALDFAPISMITPLMSFGMVTLVIFSYFYLKEAISFVEIGGIIAIIIGIVILGLTNPDEEVIFTLDETIERFSSTWSIVFLVIIFVISIGLILLSILRKYKNADILFGISAGITDALGAIFLKALMTGADFRDTTIVTESVLNWFWWFIMIIMIIFNGTATIYLQVAYQRGKAVIVAPIFAVLAMIVPVFAGIIIFSDWAIFVEQNMIGKIIWKIVAFGIIIAGAVILSTKSARTHKKENEKEPPEEELLEDIEVAIEKIDLEEMKKVNQSVE